MFLCCGATLDGDMKTKTPRTLSVLMIMTQWTQRHPVTHAECRASLRGRGYLATAALLGNSYADTKSCLLFLFMEMFKKCPFLLDAVSTFLKPWSFFLLASPMQKNSLMFIKTWDVTRVHFSVNKQLFRGRKIPSSKMNKVLKTISFQNGQHKCHCIMKRHRHLTFMEQLLTGHCVHFQTLMPRSVKTNQNPDQHIFNTRKLSGFYHNFPSWPVFTQASHRF